MMNILYMYVFMKINLINGAICPQLPHPGQKAGLYFIPREFEHTFHQEFLLRLQHSAEE